MALALAGCEEGKAASVTRNIRVTAKAEVAGKVLEGSSVMSIRWRPGPRGRMYMDLDAEVVALDLDGHGTVYVLPAVISKDGYASIGYWPCCLLAAVGARSGQV